MRRFYEQRTAGYNHDETVIASLDSGIYELDINDILLRLTLRRKRERERVVWLRFCVKQVKKMRERGVPFIGDRRRNLIRKSWLVGANLGTLGARGGLGHDGIMGEISGTVFSISKYGICFRICHLFMQTRFC
ncbi:unnamed protein product [Arabidopsis halleri]